MQSKQLVRFTQSFGYTTINSGIPNFDIFEEAIKSNDKLVNLHIFSCTAKTLTKFMQLKPLSLVKPLLKKTLSTNSKISFSQTNSLESLTKNEVVYPLNIYLDNLLYHPHSTNPENTYKSTYYSCLNILFLQNLQIVTINYKILLNTTLFNVFK